MTTSAELLDKALALFDEASMYADDIPKMVALTGLGDSYVCAAWLRMAQDDS